MKHLFLMAVLIAMVCVSAQAIVVRTTTFDTAPAYWTQVGTTDIGFSNTNNTGGTSGAGEAGGRIPGNLTYRVAYADATLGKAFDLKTTAISASGELCITGNGQDGSEQAFIGFFNTASAFNRDSLGIVILDSSSTAQRLGTYLTYSSGTSEKIGTKFVVSHGTAYTFEFSWDPTYQSGTNYGKHVITVYNPNGSQLATYTAYLTSAQFGTLGSVNAFGIGNCKDNSAWSPPETSQVTAFIDNVQYTAHLARNPNPADGATEVDPVVVTSLNWDSPVIPGTYKYDVYLGPDAESLGLVSGNQSGTSYPLTLSYGTTYYWRIDTKDSGGTLLDEGALWQFAASGGVSNPYPADGSDRVGYDAITLSWDSSTLASSWDVYMGSSPGSLSFVTNTTSPELLVDINPNSLYYWRVDTKDASNALMFTGPVWYFSTGSLMSHWKMDDASGTVAADLLGGCNGTLTDGPVWANGAIRGGLELAGGANYSISPYVDLSAHVDSFTSLGYGSIAAWVRPDTSTVDTGVIFSVSERVQTSTYFRFYVNHINGALAFSMNNVPEGTSERKLTISDAHLTDGNWHHVAVTISSQRIATLYVDGVAKGTLSDVLGFLDAIYGDTARIGSLWRGSGTQPNGLWYFDGVMDNVQLFSATLTPTEVNDLYVQGAVVRSPVPANNATNIALNTTCDWTPGFEGASQVFVLDDDPNLSADTLQQTSLSASASSIDPLGATDLNLFTEYYWRVDTIQGSWTIQGPLYKFTTATMKASDPDPSNNRTGVAQNKILSWYPGYGFNAGNGDLHKVYMGASSGSLVLVGSVGDPNFDPVLEWGSRYYWRVDEVINGTTYTGDEWVFTTTYTRQCDPEIPGDLDGNCVVNFADFAEFAANWLECTLSNGDCP